MGFGRSNPTNIAFTTALPQDDQILKIEYFEFKSIYFRVQELVNKQVNISLKYDQLKLPEIHHTIIKPISEEMFHLADTNVIFRKFTRHYNFTHNELAVKYGMNNTFESIEQSKPNISSQLIFILLLLRHEYLLQAARNLVMFELLKTKATVCEILAIRALREFDSLHLTNLLFLTPLNCNLFPSKLRELFNTLELSIISKAYKFLSQPVIIKVINRFHNGELVFKRDLSAELTEKKQLIGGSKVASYRYEKISFGEVSRRVNVVPKYQEIVRNVLMFSLLVTYLLMISVEHTTLHQVVQVLFWLIAINYNFDVCLKLSQIEFRYLRLVVWTYIDLILLSILDVCLCLKLLGSIHFGYVFSLVPIVLLPRLMLIFNNYKFFNLLVISSERMAMSLIGLVCVFFTMILGFYFSFIALSYSQSRLEILFNMVKIFFGFTPSVWDNWDDYNALGKVILMAYLFLIEFIISSILAILLSGVFAKVHQKNDEEFHLMQAVYLTLAINQGRLNRKQLFWGKSTWAYPWKLATNFVLSANAYLRLPIVVAIYVYEIIQTTPATTDKSFTFLEKELDMFGEEDTRHLLRFTTFSENYDDDLSVTKLRVNIAVKRRRSTFERSRGPPLANKTFFGSLQMSNSQLKTVQLVLTFGAANIRTASTDLTFIDELLRKKYHKDEDLKWDELKLSHSKQTSPVCSSNERIIEKLIQVEQLINQLVGDQYKDATNPVIEYSVFDPDETFEQSSVYDAEEAC